MYKDVSPIGNRTLELSKLELKLYHIGNFGLIDALPFRKIFYLHFSNYITLKEFNSHCRICFVFVIHVITAFRFCFNIVIQAIPALRSREQLPMFLSATTSKYLLSNSSLPTMSQPRYTNSRRHSTCCRSRPMLHPTGEMVRYQAA